MQGRFYRASILALSGSHRRDLSDDSIDLHRAEFLDNESVWYLKDILANASTKSSLAADVDARCRKMNARKVNGVFLFRRDCKNKSRKMNVRNERVVALTRIELDKSAANRANLDHMRHILYIIR